jgi:DNA-binding Xre family transcriptional regulator
MVKIGVIIKEKLEERGQSGKWLAQKVVMTKQNMYNIFNRNSVNSDLLYNICKAMNYDFFKFYSDSLASENIKNEPEAESGPIKELRREILSLQNENLMQIEKINQLNTRINDLNEIITSKDKLNKFYEEALDNCKEKLNKAS